MQSTVEHETHPDVEHPSTSLNGRYASVHDKLADVVIDKVGTMHFTYILTAFIVGWVIGLWHFADPYPFTTLWLIVSFIQVLLLPAILRSQNRAAAHHYAKVEADHKTLCKIAKKLDIVVNGNGNNHDGES